MCTCTPMQNTRMCENNSVLVGFGCTLRVDNVKLSDKLTIYFQKQNVSGGADVNNIQFQRNPHNDEVTAALITFEDQEAVNTVLSCKTHLVDIDDQKIPLYVKPFSVEEQTTTDMEMDFTSLDESWVELFPEVHSDDDLYSSSAPSTTSPSSKSPQDHPRKCSPIKSSSTEKLPDDYPFQSFENVRIAEDHKDGSAFETRKQFYEQPMRMSQSPPQRHDEDNHIRGANKPASPTIHSTAQPQMQKTWRPETHISGRDLDGDEPDYASGKNIDGNCIRSSWESAPKRPREMDDFKRENERKNRSSHRGYRQAPTHNKSSQFKDAGTPTSAEQAQGGNLSNTFNDYENINKFQKHGSIGSRHQNQGGGYENRHSEHGNQSSVQGNRGRGQHSRSNKPGYRGIGHGKHYMGHGSTGRGHGNNDYGQGGHKQSLGQESHETFNRTPTHQAREKHFSQPAFSDGCEELQSPDETDNQPNATVEVSKFRQSAGDESHETLLLYFENKRKSGGGKIVDFSGNGETVTITFEDPSAALAVTGRTHVLDGATLTVIPVEKKKSRPHRPVDRHRLLLTDIPDGTSHEKLLLFIEGRTKIEEDPDVMYGEIPGTAMVCYSEEIEDIEQVLNNFKKKKLQQTTVCASCVEYPDCVLVQNLPPTITDDAVELYFESERKSGGGVVREVQLNQEKSQAIVFFEDYRVVNRVVHLGHQHRLSGAVLDVSAHFDSLGVIVASDGPTPRIPDPIVVPVDPIIAEFLLDKNSPHNSHVQREILNENGMIVWPYEGQSSSVKIEPVDNANDPSCWPQWQSIVSARLAELFDEFKAESVDVEKAFWDDVCERLQGLNVGNVRPLLKSDKGRIILRGPSAEVDDTKNQLKSMVKELEAAAERAKQVIRKPVELRDDKFKLLFLCNIKEELDQKWQVDVKITLSPSSREIIFEGMRNEVAEAQIDMYNHFDNLVKHDFEVSPNKVRFIVHVLDKIHEIFTTKNIHAACNIDGNKITIIGATDQDTRQAARFIYSDITETPIAIQNQATINVLQTPQGRACLEEVNQHKVALAAVNLNNKCIEITGFRVDVQQARDKIEEYIQKNVILQKHIPLVRGKVRYLMEHAAHELQSIREHNHQHTVDIRPQAGGQQSGLMITGTDQGVKVAIQSVKALTEKVVDRQYPVAKPGMPELLKGHKGKKLLENVAKDCSCFIDSNACGDGGGKGDLEGDLVKNVILQQHTTRGGCRLMVCKGDLTRERVDAIVNAANVELNHIGGLAGDIVKKGGKIIQKESLDIIQKNGRSLLVAEAVFTGPGSLPCKHIIHVAGPKWERGSKQQGEDPTNEEDLLWDSVTNVLRAGSRRNLKSIAIPAISSGVYGFPLDLCAKTIVEATLEFCRRNKGTTLKEIRFTNINQSACDAFLMVFKAQFGEEVKFQSSGSADFVEDFGSFSSGFQGGNSFFMGATAADALPTFSRGNPVTPVVTLVTRDTVSTKENKTITLKRGDIAAENVDLIVNTTGSSMNLGSGGVSNAIAAAAGPTLQMNCTQVMTQMGISKVAAGDFIETGPGNLNCQTVFHSVCESYRGPSSEMMLRSLMQKILQQANQKGMISIAIPAIGTGTLAFPHDVAAQIFYDEAIKFSQKNPGGSLTDIRFVVYHRDRATIKAFEDEMQRLLQQGPLPTSNSGQQQEPSRPTRKLKQSQKGTSRGQVSGEEKTFRTLQTLPDGSMQMQIGHITVQLQQGDLTKDNTDAIVNSVGHDLKLNGPVSKAIVRAGGKEIKRECEQLVQQGNNEVNKGAVKTTAGRLPCRSVIHVLTPRRSKQLNAVVQKALQLAENDGMRSIAFPALGTGVGGDPGSAAHALLDAIGEFAVNSNRKSLLLIKLTIFQGSMLSTFADAMKFKETASYKPQKGFFRKGFDYMKTAFSSLSGTDDGEMIDEDISAQHEPTTLILHIFAGNTQNLEEAVERITEFIEEEFCSEEIPYEQETWGELSGSKMDRIFAIAKQNNVKIEPLLGGRAKRIVIQGRAVDVLKAKVDIQEFFTKIQLEEKKKAEDQLINKDIQWRYKDYAGIFVDYGEEINPIIERAYRDHKPFVDLELEEGIVRIDFFAKEEKHLGRKSKTVVHRADLKNEQTFNVPTNWIPMSTGQNSVTVQLTQGSQEFLQVQTTFQNSLGRAPNIHRIERIQVLDLYKQYIAKMERIKTTLPAGMQAERTLFHGTSQDACDKINRHGFNRSFHGKNGTAHGKGTYFAANASYSDGYAQPSLPNNHKHMYMCKVLTGEYAQGQPNLVSPPPKPNKPTEMYDSVVNNINNPGVFVVFHDAQAYPEYLIIYN